jgi:hypothetical protein
MQAATANETGPRRRRAAGSQLPKMTCRASRHVVFRAGRGAIEPKTAAQFAVRPQARGNYAKTARSEKHPPAVIECHMRSLTGGCNSSLCNARR